MADKQELAGILSGIAVMLELKGENTFKIRAYQGAAHTLEQMEGDLSSLIVNGKLTAIKGIGPAIGDKIREYISFGRITYYEELKTSVPPVLFDLIKLPGLGPKKALVLVTELGIHSLAELEYACRENRLITLAGFGDKTQERILQGIDYMKKFQGQFILGDAWPVADLIVEYIKLQSGVIDAAVAGAIRRGLEVVRDIDIVAATQMPEELTKALTDMPGSHELIQDGDKLTIALSSGMKCKLYIVGPEQFAIALLLITGSDGYIDKLGTSATAQGLELSKFGLTSVTGQQIPVASEADIYAALKLSYLEPELREDTAELTPATQKLPPLVTYQDITGVFHIHTTYSDGSNNLGEMAEAAKQRGWQYLGIADHSQTAVYARGLRVEAVLAQRAEIDKFNTNHPDFVILAGIESDILPDGSLDYPDDVLASFDFVVASVHSAFRQSEADMTRRIVRAIQNPYVNILGHPTGRILLGRKGYAVDLKEVIAAAASTGTFIEINASPYRLDLDWRWCRSAKDQGVLFAINPDAHAVSEYEHMRYGLAAARKGGLTADDIVNTRSFPEVGKLLKRKRK